MFWRRVTLTAGTWLAYVGIFMLHPTLPTAAVCFIGFNLAYFVINGDT